MIPKALSRVFVSYESLNKTDVPSGTPQNIANPGYIAFLLKGTQKTGHFLKYGIKVMLVAFLIVLNLIGKELTKY